MIKDGLSTVIKDDESVLDEDEDDAKSANSSTYGGGCRRICRFCKDECSCWNYNGDHEVVCEECGVEKKEVDETNGWEEVYNASNQTKGNPLGGQPRENPRLPGQEGIFYQTYGNGGGAGGWGGYWAMRVSNGQHVGCPYEVASEEFKLLEGVGLEFRPEDSFRRVVAAVRIVPLTQERIAEALRKHALYQQEKQRILKVIADVKERAAVDVEMRKRADRLLRGTAV
jgi:hypothetical protein